MNERCMLALYTREKAKAADWEASKDRVLRCLETFSYVTYNNRIKQPR